jgi:hypothetical protein
MIKKLINISIFYILISICNIAAKEPKQVSFVTGVGSTHFEAHRMAVNSANNSRMRVSQQISQKSRDGLWHVILKVTSK